MRKDTFLLISTGTVAVVIVALYFFGPMVFIQKPKPGTIAGDVRTEENKYDPGSQLRVENSRYGRAIDFASGGDMEVAARELIAIRDDYAPGSIEFNIIDYTLAQLYMFRPDASEAVDRLKAIVTNKEGFYNNVTRALSIEGLLRVASNFKKEDIVRIFSGDTLFISTFARAEGDYFKALHALALEGYALSKTPITSARLAQKAALDIETKAYTTAEEKAALLSALDEYLEAGEVEIRKVADLPNYNGYRAEYYSIRAAALGSLFLAKEGTASKTEIERLYQEAYTLASESAKPYIAFKYASFLVDVGDKSDTQTIESLISKVALIPAARRIGFDAYLKNALALGPSGGLGYSMIVNLRSADKRFDAYVADVLSR
jgi:hypothetical protein